MWHEEYVGTCFDTIHANFNFDPYVNFDPKYLTNAATSGPDKFFHYYLHYIPTRIYKKILLLEFVQGEIVFSPYYVTFEH